jgi:hypothetical protein
VRPGDRVKTDPRDARRLARLHAGVVRAREDARLDWMRDRHRTSKFLLRHGLRMPDKSWGITRRSSSRPGALARRVRLAIATDQPLRNTWQQRSAPRGLEQRMRPTTRRTLGGSMRHPRR